MKTIFAAIFIAALTLGCSALPGGAPTPTATPRVAFATTPTIAATGATTPGATTTPTPFVINLGGATPNLLTPTLAPAPGASVTVPTVPCVQPVATGCMAQTWAGVRTVAGEVQRLFPGFIVPVNEPAVRPIPNWMVSVGFRTRTTGEWRQPNPALTGWIWYTGQQNLSVFGGVVETGIYPGCANPVVWPVATLTPTWTSTPGPTSTVGPTDTPGPTSTATLTSTPTLTPTPTATATSTPTATPTVDLHVQLRPVPDQVMVGQTTNLTTQVSGSAQGTILYQFSCDGQNWGSQSSTPSQTCVYTTAGQKVPRVRVWRQNLTVEGVATVNVVAPTATSTSTPTRTATPTLMLSVSPVPNVGNAPLTSQINLSVSGTAAGAIDWKVDCNGDGSWEHSFSNSSLTAAVSCSYPSAGAITVRAQAVKQGQTITGSASVIVR